MADKVADALGVGRQSVLHHLRNLGVRKLITYHGRGRHAAGMTPLDAARLTIAVVGSPLVKDSVATVEQFGSLERDWGRRGAHLRFAAAPVSDTAATKPSRRTRRNDRRRGWRISWRCGSIGFGTAIRRAPTAIRSLCRSASRIGSRLPRSNCAAPLRRRSARVRGGPVALADRPGRTGRLLPRPDVSRRSHLGLLSRASRPADARDEIRQRARFRTHRPRLVGDAGTGVAAGEGPGPQRPRRKVRLRCHGRDDHARPVERFVASATRAFSD